MLDEYINIKKLIYNKNLKILFVELTSKRYIYFNEEEKLTQKIRDKLKLGNQFPDISLVIECISLNNENMHEYIADIYENMFIEFKDILLYKSIMKYQLENQKVIIFFPNELTKITELNQINEYLKNCSKRIGGKYIFSINIINDEDAIKIRDNSVRSIKKEMPVIVIKEQEENEEDQVKPDEKITRICELDSNSYKVIIEGSVTYVKQYKSSLAHLFEFGLSDLSGSIVCKKFFKVDDPKIEKYEKLIQENIYINVKGKHQIEKNSPKYFINADRVTQVNLSARQDKAKIKRIEFNINSDLVNTELMVETVHKWKHEAVGIMAKENLNSFIELHKNIEQKALKIKPIYGFTVKVLMDDSSAVFNPNKTKISSNIFVGEIKDESIFISDLCYEQIKRTEIFKKNDYIGIRNFCLGKALYIFSEVVNEDAAQIIAKSGITVINVKKVFELLDKKAHTLNSLMLKLNSTIENIPSAAHNASLILKNKFESYEDICIYIANNNISSENADICNISLLVKNNEGLKNLYKILTKRNCLWNIVPKSYLEAHRYGLLIGSSDTDGELYKLLFDDADTEIIYTKALFYDYINLLSDKHGQILKDMKIVKTLTEFRNFNKFLFKCANENNIIAIASCYSNDLSKNELLTTNEMLSEFSYLTTEGAKKAVIENTRQLNMEIEKIAPISINVNKEDLLSNNELLSLEDGSENFKNEIHYINKNRLSSIVLVIKKILEKLKQNDIIYQIESIMTPYIFSLILNENSLTVNQTVSSDFKIHVQADKINDVFSIINDISVLHRPFFVNYQKYTAIHMLSEGFTIYDFTPMKMNGNDMVTQYHSDILKDYFPTIFIQPDEDLLMIKRLKDITDAYPTDDLLDKIAYSDVYVCTEDSKFYDVISMVKPATKNEFLRCIGLIYGQGTWYDNAENLIHQKLAEIYDIICFKYENDDNKKDDEMIKESKRKIKSLITYEEAIVHGNNLLVIKWYFDNYKKQFILEYINRYRDFRRFNDEFDILPADVSISKKNSYIEQQDYKYFIEPLSVIKYIDEKLIDKIVENRPYISIDDFANRNNIDNDTLIQLQKDGYLRSLDETSQIDLSSLFE